MDKVGGLREAVRGRRREEAEGDSQIRPPVAPALHPDGLGLLAHAGSHGPLALIAASFFYALFRVRIQTHLQREGHDAFELAFARIMSMGIIGVLLVAVDALTGGPCLENLIHIMEITREQWLWTCLSCCLSGLGGSLLHFRAQSLVPAANAQPFFALTPIFAAIWSWLLLDESLPISLLVTAAIMVSGAILASSDTKATMSATSGGAPRIESRRRGSGKLHAI